MYEERQGFKVDAQFYGLLNKINRGAVTHKHNESVEIVWQGPQASQNCVFTGHTYQSHPLVLSEYVGKGRQQVHAKYCSTTCSEV